MDCNRRDFLRTAAVGLSAFFLPTAAARFVHAGSADPVLVALYMRGGADGLNLVVPRGDAHYYAARPTIQVPAGEELDLDGGFFGMHPTLAPLLPLYRSGELAFVHAVGSSDATRSHFDAQDFMERAAPGDRGESQGWLNRYLAREGDANPMAGVSLRSSKALSMRGEAPSLAFETADGFRLTGAHVEERRAELHKRYGTAGAMLGEAVDEAFDALDAVATVGATDGKYPSDRGVAAALREAAALIKADIGVRVIAIDAGGWDHHSDEAPRFAALGGELAAALAAFHADLDGHRQRTMVLGMTEFGRRVAENGARGTDHGHGGVMFALGGGLSGGRVLTRDDTWPGLAPEHLDEGKDLAATTDFRDVFAEVLHTHMGVADIGSFFPNYSARTEDFPGLFS